MSDPVPLSTRSESGPAPRSGHPRLCVGIVNHGSYDDLERCLRALDRQRHPLSGIAVYDTGVDPDRFDAMRRAHPEVVFEIGANRGYAGGANRVLAQCVDMDAETDFILILNPDVELDPDFGVVLLKSMAERRDVAIASGKLLRPGRQKIDSAGIRFPRHGRPRDRGSEKLDLGQFDETESVAAVSGAAMMIRVESFEDLRVDGELFDEDFFAYHEDTDLCWRARRLGWTVLYEPKARAVHARGWRKERRREIEVSIRRHSFKNHYLQLAKNQSGARFMTNLPWLFVWEVLRLGFVLTKDRPMLGAYREAWKALPASLRKRRTIRDRLKDPARGPSGPA